MIDWSEARVDDPAIDMAAHLMVFGEEGLAKLLLTYEAAGGARVARVMESFPAPDSVASPHSMASVVMEHWTRLASGS